MHTLTPVKTDRIGSGKLVFEPLYQVILYNDDIHSMNEVVEALMTTFGHPLNLAKKLMKEANDTTRAIVEVEDKELAQLHKDQLQSKEFTVDIEPIKT